MSYAARQNGSPAPANRFPPMKSDPFFDDIPESSWVSVSGEQLAILIEQRKAQNAAASDRAGRRR